MHGLTKDETGKTYGRLKVLRQSFMRDGKPVKGVHWLCLCQCTKRTVVLGARLRSGGTRSCGCLQDDHYFRHYRLRYFSKIRRDSRASTREAIREW